MPTRPGLHPDLDLSLYPRDVLMAVHRISEYFYVTKDFKPERVGNSEYWAVLARPAEDFSVIVNADREIIILFSSYLTFEVRTLEAFDAFYAHTESKRVDRSLRFLISGDIEIERKIQHYLNQNPEYPIIIPSTFASLRQSPDNPLLSAVRRNYLIRDLFGYQNPLREETFFFGRSMIINAVLDLAKSGQSSSIFGLRKSGKTSTIYAIQRKARAYNCSCRIIDCQLPAVHARRYSELLAHVVSEVRSAIGESRSIADLGNGDVVVSEKFISEMKSALGRAKGRVLLVFDEIENISPATAASPHWRDEKDTILFWQNIRSLVQSTAGEKLAVCLVGTSPQLLEVPSIHGIPNPMYLFSQKMFLPGFDFDQIREMVERLGYFMGLSFDPKFISDLQETYGGHPFFIRQACSKIHQLVTQPRPISVSGYLLERAKSEFSGQLSSYLTEIISQLKLLYPGEYDLLQSFASGDSDEIREYSRVAPELLDHLVGYGLVARFSDSVEIAMDAVGRVLADMRSSSISTMTWEERIAEISYRRNRVERGIRNTFYIWSKQFGASDWNDILDCLPQRRREQLVSIEPRVLFASKTSPLYLSDILAMAKHRSIRSLLGEGSSAILSALHSVNFFRIDAHAKDIAPDDFRAVQEALELLELEFAEP